jgi:hypothetical protein
MTTEEEIAHLKKELAAERAENSHLRHLPEEALRRLGEVEGELVKDSHKTSKPLSSGGLGRKRVSLRNARGSLWLSSLARNTVTLGAGGIGARGHDGREDC